jgi:formamidopyrimidine-DNA glycosylase
LLLSRTPDTSLARTLYRLSHACPAGTARRLLVQSNPLTVNSRQEIVPELPDITVYIDALDVRIRHQPLERIRLKSPFLLRTIDPPLQQAEGQTVDDLRRVGKRIAIGLSNDLWLVLHLMIAGRLHWRKPGVALTGRNMQAAFDFPEGTLLLTEAGTERRASLHLVRDPYALDPGGIEVLSADMDAFAAALTRENHTLKRALSDPTLFSGIGNAYSDEILHRARLSPLALTGKLKPEEIGRLYAAVRTTLTDWIERLRRDARGRFPEKVTAFREGMAVHGRYKQPCPVCGARVARIRYASNETNYCPTCQTGGKLLADRAFSRLLGKDWADLVP